MGRSPGEENGNPSSILACRIPWTEEPGRLQSIGLQRSSTQLNNNRTSCFSISQSLQNATSSGQKKSFISLAHWYHGNGWCSFFFFEVIYLFLATVGVCCSEWAFSSCVKWGLLSVAVSGLLIAVASLIAEHRPQSSRASLVAACGLQSLGSAVVAWRA